MRSFLAVLIVLSIGCMIADAAGGRAVTRERGRAVSRGTAIGSSTYASGGCAGAVATGTGCTGYTAAPPMKAGCVGTTTTIYQPPPVTITPPPITIQPPPITVTPPPVVTTVAAPVAPIAAPIGNVRTRSREVYRSRERSRSFGLFGAPMMMSCPYGVCQCQVIITEQKDIKDIKKDK